MVFMGGFHNMSDDNGDAGGDHRVVLGRLDERVKNLTEKMDHLDGRLDLYTLLSRYLTTERIVFALIAVLSSSVVVAMIALVLKK